MNLLSTVLIGVFFRDKNAAKLNRKNQITTFNCKIVGNFADKEAVYLEIQPHQRVLKYDLR